MLQLAPGWTVTVERGPGWLLVRLGSSPQDQPQANLAEGLWSLMQQHFINRLVLELDDLPLLDDRTIDQLKLLQARIHQHDGMLRICGQSDENHSALCACGFEGHLPRCRTREEAILGFHPSQPR